MTYKAISKHHLVYCKLFIHNKYENDQKYLCGVFHNWNIKKESSRPKKHGDLLRRHQGSDIVQSEGSTLWNHVSGLRFPHGTSMTWVDYVCISLILSKSSTYYVPGVFLCMGHTAENRWDLPESSSNRDNNSTHVIGISCNSTPRIRGKAVRTVSGARTCSSINSNYYLEQEMSSYKTEEEVCWVYFFFFFSRQVMLAEYHICHPTEPRVGWGDLANCMDETPALYSHPTVCPAEEDTSPVKGGNIHRVFDA